MPTVAVVPGIGVVVMTGGFGVPLGQNVGNDLVRAFKIIKLLEKQEMKHFFLNNVKKLLS